MTAEKPAFSHKTAIHLLLIVALGLLAYSNSLEVPLQFDDKASITENPLIKDFRFFQASSDTREVPMRYDLYSTFKHRLVGYLTLAYNYRAHGLDVRGYHAVNLAIHLISALLVYWLVVLTFRTRFLRESALSARGKSVALFSALLFVSHPVQTQAVTYIVQRFSSLATLFYLLSLALYARNRLYESSHSRATALYALSIVSAVLAMKTKETAFTLPVIAVLYELFFFSGSIKRRLLYLLPLALTMLIVPLSLIGVDRPLGEIIGGVAEAARLESDMPRADYLLTQFRVIATYMRLLFLPVNQNLDYDYPVFRSLLNPQVFLSFVLLLSVFGAGIYMAYRSRKRNASLRLAAFGIFWFFVTLSVESSIIPIVDVAFEHRLYLPSAGFFMAASAGCFFALRLFNEKPSGKAVTAALCLLPIVLSSASYARNDIWRSSVVLWEDVVKKSPQKARAHNNLAAAYESAGDVETSLKHYETAAVLDPDSAPIRNNLASAYASAGMFEEAAGHFSLAMELDPGYVQTYNDLGSAYYKMGRTELAIEQYERAIGMQPAFIPSYINLGVIYNDRGRPDKAAEYLKQAVALRPDIAEARYNLALSYSALSRHEDAIEEYSFVLSLEPANETAHYNIGNAYLATGKSEKAIEHYARAIMLKPDYTEAYVNLGIAYKKTGRMDKAIEYYAKAVSAGPDNAEAHYNLANAYMQQGRIDEAITHYEKAITLRPEDPSAHNNLAVAYRMKGLEAEALKHIRMAEELKQKNR